MSVNFNSSSDSIEQLDYSKLQQPGDDKAKTEESMRGHGPKMAAKITDDSKASKSRRNATASLGGKLSRRSKSPGKKRTARLGFKALGQQRRESSRTSSRQNSSLMSVPPRSGELMVALPQAQREVPLTLPMSRDVTACLGTAKDRAQVNDRACAREVTQELKAMGFSKGDIKLIRQAFENCELSVNLKPGIFNEIMKADDPQYLNKFEQGKYETKRQQAEDLFFYDGNPPDEASDRLRYCAGCPIPFEYGGANSYGDVAIIFSTDQLRDNCTMTAYDTWDQDKMNGPKSVGDMQHPNAVLLDRIRKEKSVTSRKPEIREQLQMTVNYMKRQDVRSHDASKGGADIPSIHDGVFDARELVGPLATELSSLHTGSPRFQQNLDMVLDEQGILPGITAPAAKAKLKEFIAENFTEICSGEALPALEQRLSELLSEGLCEKWSDSSYYEVQVHSSSLPLNSQTVAMVRANFDKVFNSEHADRMVANCQKHGMALVWATQGGRYFIDPRTQTNAAARRDIPPGHTFNEVYEQIPPQFRDSIGN